MSASMSKEGGPEGDSGGGDSECLSVDTPTVASGNESGFSWESG